MAAPQLSQDDYRDAFLAMLPVGEVWPRDAWSVLAQVSRAFVGSFHRNHTGAADLLVDVFPATAVDLLGEWEATVGLPTACTPLGSTIGDRQLQVAARLADIGGASAEDFLRLATTFGYVAPSIEVFAPFRVDLDTVEWPIYEDGWAFVWWLHATSLGPIIDASLECEISAIAPAFSVFDAIFVGGDGFNYDFDENFGG